MYDIDLCMQMGKVHQGSLLFILLLLDIVDNISTIYDLYDRVLPG